MPSEIVIGLITGKYFSVHELRLYDVSIYDKDFMNILFLISCDTKSCTVCSTPAFFRIARTDDSVFWYDKFATKFICVIMNTLYVFQRNEYFHRLRLYHYVISFIKV